MRMKPELKLAYKQLDVIDYLEKAYSKRKFGNYIIAGGWAVDGIVGKMTGPHKNVDVMVHEAHANDFGNTLLKYGKKKNLDFEDIVFEETHGSLPNLHAEFGDVEVDAIIMYPMCWHRMESECDEGYNSDRDYVIFETPYHTPFAPIPSEFMRGIKGEVKGVSFNVLQPATLYMAKLTSGRSRSKKEAERDLKDLRCLSKFVSPKMRQTMKRFA